MSSLQQRQSAKRAPIENNSATREEVKEAILGVLDVCVRFVGILVHGAAVSLFFCTILGLAANDFFRAALKPEYQAYYVHDEPVREDAQLTPKVQDDNAIARNKVDDPSTPEDETKATSIDESETGVIVAPIKSDSLLDAAYLSSLFSGSWYGLAALRWPLFLMIWAAFVLGRVSRIRRQVIVVPQHNHCLPGNPP